MKMKWDSSEDCVVVVVAAGKVRGLFVHQRRVKLCWVPSTLGAQEVVMVDLEGGLGPSVMSKMGV